MAIKEYKIKYTKEMNDEILRDRIEDLQEIDIQGNGKWFPCVGNNYYKGNIFSEEFLSAFDVSGNTFILYSTMYENEKFSDADRFGMIVGKSKEIPKVKKRLENLLGIKMEELQK